MPKPILCVDFDGVLHSYKSGWNGAQIVADPPVDGALEFLIRATEHFQVCIYSSRSRQWGGKRAMKQWLWDRYAEIGGVKRRDWFLGPFGYEKDIPEIPKWWFQSILAKTHMEPWEYEVDAGIKNFLKKSNFRPRSQQPF